MLTKGQKVKLVDCTMCPQFEGRIGTITGVDARDPHFYSFSGVQDWTFTEGCFELINEVSDDEKHNPLFDKLCRLSQKQLKTMLESEYDFKPVVGGVFHKGTVGILLTAHMDTIHKSLCTDIVYSNGRASSPQGIGGDDRCGIYMALQIMRKHDVSVLFLEDEEIGSVGADYFIKSKDAAEIRKMDFGYIIELDRKNGNDAVFYKLDNKEFEKFITQTYWKKAYGTFSDICVLAPFFGVAAVNLSCGYYNPHMTTEYVVMSEMYKNIKEVIKLVERSEEGVTFPWKSTWTSYYDDDWYTYGYTGNDSNSTTTKNDVAETSFDSFKEDFELEVYVHEWAATAYNKGKTNIKISAKGKTKAEAWLNICLQYKWLSFNMVDDFYFN